MINLGTGSNDDDGDEEEGDGDCHDDDNDHGGFLRSSIINLGADSSSRI